jgi:hypothetical protein
MGNVPAFGGGAKGSDSESDGDAAKKNVFLELHIEDVVL